MWVLLMRILDLLLYPFLWALFVQVVCIVVIAVEQMCELIMFDGHDILGRISCSADS